MWLPLLEQRQAAHGCCFPDGNRLCTVAAPCTWADCTQACRSLDRGGLLVQLLLLRLRWVACAAAAHVFMVPWAKALSQPKRRVLWNSQ